MSQNIENIHLVIRENRRQAERLARQNIMRAAVTGQDLKVEDVAMARGLVMRERENSIFSDAWVPLAVIFVIIGLAAGRQAAMLALGFVLLLIVGVSTVWKNLSLLGVTYERRFNRNRVFPGESIEMTITVGNDKLLPLTWLQFRDELPVAVEDEDAIGQVTSEMNGRYTLLNTFSLYGREQTERTFTLRFPKRGFYKLGPVTYESGDIFTLFTRQRDHLYLDQLIIFPQIYPLEELGLPAKEPFGEVKVYRSLFTDPIKTQGVRDYQPGDRFRDVHWKATAVRGSLQTKVYDPSTGMTIAVFLNVATFPRHWMGFDPELLERGVSVAGSIANYGIQQGWGVGVYANGSIPNSDQPIRVQPGRSPEQLAHILEALAAVTEFATGSIENMMMRTSPSLPWASTIVLVTAVVTDEMMVALLRLKEAGRRVVLISLADEPPPKGLGNILTYHIPATVPAFQQGHQASTVTEAALSSIPTPEPVGLEFELEKTI
ncbi:MAG: DUF58 domain-containing protein [Ardenticatenaceae bacterium]|nr:DUF58 domain-containing protein [Ardenticatenaceae bacterium]